MDKDTARTMNGAAWAALVLCVALGIADNPYVWAVFAIACVMFVLCRSIKSASKAADQFPEAKDVTSLAQNFAQRFHSLADEELLELATQQNEMVEAASLALQEELEHREIGQDALREFKDRRDSEVVAAEKPSENAPVTQVDLPDNWFNADDLDNEGDTVPSLASRRTKGITVAAFVFWASGPLNLFFGILSFKSNMAITIFTFVASLACLIIGVGLWRLRPWARTSAVVLLWTMAALNAATIIIVATLRLRGFAVNPILTGSAFLWLLWQLLWALYLGRQTTRSIFETAAHS